MIGIIRRAWDRGGGRFRRACVRASEVDPLISYEIVHKEALTTNRQFAGVILEIAPVVLFLTLG